MPIVHYRPINYVKTAVLWAFYHLKRQSTYEVALRDMLKRGGDTAVNAAIVGGLIGALNVDNSKLNQILNEINAAEHNQGSGFINYAREDFERSIMNIYNKAPTNLTVKWGTEEFKD
jgi:ADP-ribosylglycohydrolase